MKQGDLVTIKPDYCLAGEQSMVFVVTEWNGERGYIASVYDIQRNWLILPTELVRDYMIAPFVPRQHTNRGATP